MPNFKADDTKTEAQSSQSKAALLSSISSQAPADLTPLDCVAWVARRPRLGHLD